MCVQCEVLEDERIIVLTVTGRLRPGDMAAAFEEGKKTPKYDPGWGSLVDLSEADLSDMSPEFLRQDAQYVSTVRNSTPHKRGVVLGEKDINRNAGKLIDAYCRALRVPQVTRLFTDRDECKRWLAAPWTEEERRRVSQSDAMRDQNSDRTRD